MINAYRFVGLSKVATFALLACCVACNRGAGGSAATPTAPTISAPTTPAIALQSITITPSGAGVQHNTNFQFAASGTFPVNTQFQWQFGDGASLVTTSPNASHLYTQAGTFNLVFQATSAGTTVSAARQVSVKNLIGRWLGVVRGHTYFPPSRPIPITSFELTVNGLSVDGTTIRLAGTWADNAGCRANRGLNQLLNPSSTASVRFGVESLSCNDGDFYMSGTADLNFDVVEGDCVAFGGPNCSFRMSRQ